MSAGPRVLEKGRQKDGDGGQRVGFLKSESQSQYSDVMTKPGM